MANEEVRREWLWGRMWCVNGDLEPPVLLCEGLFPEGSPSLEPCLFKTQYFLFCMALFGGKLFIVLLFVGTSRGEIQGTLVKVGCSCWDSTMWALVQEPWFSPASPWTHIMLPAKVALLFPSKIMELVFSDLKACPKGLTKDFERIIPFQGRKTYGSREMY